MVYAGNGYRAFLALDGQTGKELWTFTAGNNQWSEWSAPALSEDVVYVGHSDKTLYALDRSTGKALWQFTAEDWATTDPILAEGVLYFGVGAHANLAQEDDDRFFYALDARTGQELWTFKGQGLVYSGGAAIGEGVIYFKTLAGILYALHSTGPLTVSGIVVLRRYTRRT